MSASLVRSTQSIQGQEGCICIQNPMASMSVADFSILHIPVLSATGGIDVTSINRRYDSL